MTREWGDYAADILNAIREVEAFTEGMTKDVFVSHRKTVNGVIRSLEVMGAAAKRVPDEARAKYPEVPWKRMAGMRDKLIHEYTGMLFRKMIHCF